MFPKSVLIQSSFLRDAEGGGAGGGGDGGDDVQERINAAVEEAVSGLKKTNAALKAEKQELAKRLEPMAAVYEKLGGEEGVEGLLQMKQRLEKDETGKLLADGKYDEWFDQRAGAMKADYERKLAAHEQALQERDEALKAAKSQLYGTLLDRDIGQACDKAEIKDAGAREHARMLAERQFVYDDEAGQHVVKDRDGGIVYGKDGKTPKSMVEWIEEKREVPEYRLWWPESRGAGLGNGALPAAPDRRMEAMSKAPYRDYKAQRMKEMEAQGR